MQKDLCGSFSLNQTLEAFGQHIRRNTSQVQRHIIRFHAAFEQLRLSDTGRLCNACLFLGPVEPSVAVFEEGYNATSTNLAKQRCAVLCTCFEWFTS